MPFAPSISVDLWFEQSGSGDDVLLIGGPLDESTSWTGLTDALVASGHRVTRYDPRGNGRSSAVPGPCLLDDLAADAAAVARAAGIDRAHVLGASLGSATAQRLAQRAPGLVRSLTLTGAWAEPDRALRAVLGSWTWAAERARAIDELLGVVQAFAGGPRGWDSGAVDDLIVAAQRSVGPERFAAARSAFVAQVRAALDHEARPVDPPVLLIVGALDAVTPEHHARELERRLEGAQLEVVGGTGHAVHRERPDVVAAALTRAGRPLGATLPAAP